MARRRFAMASLEATSAVLGLFLISAAADVFIMTRTYNLDPIPDLPADFGPDLPAEGLEGFLKTADPEDGCTPFAYSDFTTTWVALIARQQTLHPSLNCTFDIKVRHAQDAGASAAIVWDDEYESLIIMSKPRTHPDPIIPSVFVSEKAGLLMRKLLELEGEEGVRVRITPVSAVAWVSMVMSAVLGLLALTVVFSTFYLMRSWSLWLSGATGVGVGPGGAPGVVVVGVPRPAEGGLPPHVLRALPVLIYDSAPPSRNRSLPNSMRSAYTSCALEEAEAGGHMPSAPGKAATGGEEGGAGGEVGAYGVECDGSSNSSEYEATAPRGVHAGETKRTCTVCLEDYEEGEKLRVLPCHHRFHMACIDQWFQSRRVCPMCKHDASKPLVHPAPAGEAAEAGAASGLSARLAGVRRAWMAAGGGTGRGAGGTGAGGPSSPVSAALRRGAIRSRIIRWMGLRPMQRQAVLSALGGDLTELDEPLLEEAAGGDLEEGQETTQQEQEPGAGRTAQQQQLQQQLVSVRDPGRTATAPINIDQPGGAVATGGASSDEIHDHVEVTMQPAIGNLPAVFNRQNQSA